MRTTARLLIAEESHSSDGEARAALRVCDKLGRSLAALAGVRGFRSLLNRALSLAAAEEKWLRGLTVSPNGALALSKEAEAEADRKDAAQAGLLLVTKLLELLVTFIGEALTLRLVQQVWPKAALGNRKTGAKT